MAKQGSKNVTMSGLGGKRQITVVFFWHTAWNVLAAAAYLWRENVK